MASIYLRHAYYSVYIVKKDQIKIRFENWCNQSVSVTTKRIAFSPRIFTKTMKQVYATLRLPGCVNSGYIDDSFLASDTFKECEENVIETVHLLTEIGFMIHRDKFVVVPTKKLTFETMILDQTI